MKRLDARVSELADGLTVRRVLPQRARRAVGPFVFFDHFGPVEVAAGAGDVGPHPHIGLATVTSTFEGGFVHRDSLGNEVEITPGAVNWMSAGRGVVHSERAPRGADGRAAARRLHGLQLWVALPRETAESEPSFQHVPKDQIPETLVHGARVRVLVGEALGVRSPVRTASSTLYLDVEIDGDVAFAAGGLAEEVAIFAPTDPLLVNGEEVGAATMAVLEAGDVVSAPPQGSGRARFVVIGGATIEPVRMWWNFVARDAAAIEAAARRWECGGFDPVPGESERVAMPTYVSRTGG